MTKETFCSTCGPIGTDMPHLEGCTSYALPPHACTVGMVYDPGARERRYTVYCAQCDATLVAFQNTWANAEGIARWHEENAK